MKNHLTIKLIPPLRTQFDMARMEQVYHDRLLDLYERNMDALEREYRAQNSNPISRWKTFNKIAMIEATIDLLPYERKQMIAEVLVEPISKI
jgi:hypothetical protein